MENNSTSDARRSSGISRDIRIPCRKLSTANGSSSFSRKGSMAQSLRPSLQKSVDSHVMIDIRSPNFKMNESGNEDDIIHSLRASYLTDHFQQDQNVTPSDPSKRGVSSPSVYLTPSEKISNIDGHIDSVDDHNIGKIGADITRDIYKIATSNNCKNNIMVKSTEDIVLAMENKRRQSTASGLNVPGGFRREFIVNKVRQEQQQQNHLRPTSSNFSINSDALSDGAENFDKIPFLTRNFLEFLYIYGHFAGESFEDDFLQDDNEYLLSTTERTPLLPSQSRLSKAAIHSARGTTSTAKTFLLLLKSFMGTGILFLPAAFHNGGLLFSIIMLFFFGIYSYWCYYILTKAKVATGQSSFGDIGLKLYGPSMKFIILFSLVLTQLGFSAAYMIFTAKNLNAFCQNFFLLEDINFIYLMGFQLFFSSHYHLSRKVSKLSLPSLIANVFVMTGLAIVLFFLVRHLFLELHLHPAAGVIPGLNSDRWTMFIGTAIFAFEGIGLIIPIQDSMKNPEKFPLVLGFVLIAATFLFITIASIGYLSYGSSTEVVILLNLPQDSIFVISIQLFYSLAIMLSTPLQMFPAIKIIENKVFPRFTKIYVEGDGDRCDVEFRLNSGKANWKVKWLKNFVRSIIVSFVIIFAYYEVDNLDKVVSLIGSFACIPLVYIYPPLLHLRSRSRSQSPSGDPSKWKLVLDHILVVFGGISMIYTSYQSMFGT
ncbi:Avt4p NDAI_0F02660 [Naumovozyma dairenensis CBS 421]|uniref:Amino acid transporter transmembrane domain-containing protein n=1 Tax=Naumovozyma dairenensis (strain ATCC 10597 / BCRC 20456 / CBS 421 / NBRC 0211 / NRRL Y-12639) TaxID=1071378 RepID=G0WCS3_NAUDC|nr:hypothetical protein NDAI_0F02660 [Naumovozyma dairenensis CBS 421]CCD25584.1 hypothetical protein NDAI_0F02660 [Naumovozyma dairenensis CBS 421]